MKATFKVTFLLQKGKVKASGRAPIVARIIVNGDMAHFSTQQDIEPEFWNSKAGRTLGNTPEQKGINNVLTQIAASVQRFYYDMQSAGDSATALKLKNKVCATEEKPIKSTMELFDKFISEYAEIVEANNYGTEALLRYKVTKSRVQEFFEKELKAKDLPLDQITKRLLDRFYLWLRSEYKVGNNTAILFIHKFSTVYKMAWDNGWVSGNPFHLQHLKKDKVERCYLTVEELDKLAKREFTSERLEKMRDIFLFCCYTGMSYIDIKELTTDNIEKKSDVRMWIMTKRTKTEIPVHVPLLDIPLRLIDKYEPLRKKKGTKLLFPVPSNQKGNDYLKEIAALCGIDKNMTFHTARHTFATTITLDNGVPIESVSKMLGHTNILTTQIYAKIIDRKTGHDMEKLSEKLDLMPEDALPDSEYLTDKEKKLRRELRAFAFERGLSIQA